MSEKYCDADKRECKIYLSGIYNLNCQRCGYLRALSDAVAAVEKINLDDDYPINIITKAITAIEKLKEEK